MSALSALTAATKALANDPSWTGLLGENVMIAQCEGFVQSSIAGRVNFDSPSYFVDRERVFHAASSKTQPDVLVIDRERRADWFASRDLAATQRTAATIPLVSGVVYLKCAWVRYAKASGALATKVASVARDADQISTLRRSSFGGEGLIGVVLTDYPTANEVRAGNSSLIDDAQLTIARALPSFKLHAHELLTSYRGPLWPAGEAVTCRMLWFNDSP